MQLVEGPFSTLEGTWQFMPLGEPVGEGGRQACKVTLDLRYAFAGRALDAVLSPVFDRVANTLIDAFVARAEVVYGPR
jgi:ribosome-associated toxin RatA of RatAB toxin-antitoxin module